ncbi:hypothetical protein L861_16410 [Litchfieldella anticariensis FP35 = DSM 16096]|uniref:LysR substrate-binding domain-containing protein n=1 Tax=Litchfieldella anticariensis (strain DSM 16096 / CECT 5854 / CIP 108499 / LMG 22089 / FP35) TaxID=1121939 RepID=S2LA58_LITA3|nr:LysR substrate-binding domain-containing protein [Halomonas anticariensis]EPC01601.1 hypothetical protein L861_16410 [Halomonas anticariensis FP35 = DSM 16096]
MENAALPVFEVVLGPLGFSNQIGLILELVARGLGFTVLPYYARQAFAHREEIQVVEGSPPVVDKLWLVHHAEWPLSSRAQLALEYLRSMGQFPNV